MATLYITEYARQQRDAAGYLLPIGEEPALVEQTVAIGGGSLQSAVFNAATKFVRLHTDVICSRKFGANPTATAAMARMAANTTEFLGVGEAPTAMKVAVITNT